MPGLFHTHLYLPCVWTPVKFFEIGDDRARRVVHSVCSYADEAGAR